MRTEIITGLQALTLGTFRVATELPFEAQGQPLYEKNFKTFYAGKPETLTTTLVNTLNGPRVREKETSVIVYVMTDAKNQPSNYDTLMASVEDLIDLSTITGVITREVDKTITLEEDTLLTEFEFRFTEVDRVT